MQPCSPSCSSGALGAGAVFLIQEMDGPFDGLIQVSADPLRYALTRLGL